MRRILLALLLLFCGAGPAQKRLLLQGEPSLDQLIRQQSPTLWLDSSQSEVGPLRHFNMDDNAASTAVVDASGNANGVASANTDTFDAAGKIGNALDFDGDTLYVSTGSDVIGTGEDSACAWVYVDGDHESGAGQILYNGTLYWYPNNAATATVSLACDGATNLPSGAVLADGVWTHLCFTRTAAGTAQHYVNGVAAGAAGSCGAPAGGTGNVIIGGNGAGGLSFNGKIDDVRIYNRALTAGEIALIYNNGAGHQSQSIGNNSGTVVYDAASPIVSQWSDKSGNGRNAVQATDAAKFVLSRSDNRENVTTYSDQLGSLNAWGKLRCARVSDIEIKEDGTAGAIHSITSGSLHKTGDITRVKLSAKRGVGSRNLYMRLYSNLGGTSHGTVTIDLGDGSIASTFGTHTTPPSATLNEETGYYDIVLHISTISVPVPPLYLEIRFADAVYSTVFDGDNTSTLFLTRAQVSSSLADPSYVATTTYPQFRGLNGRPVLVAQGAQFMTMTAKGSDIFANNAKTFFAVVRPAAATAAANRFILASGDYWHLWLATTAAAYHHNYDTDDDYAVSGAITASPLIISGTHEAGNLTINVNGVEGTPDASGNTGSLAGALGIGNRAAMDRPFFGDIAELLTFNKVLPSDVRDRIQRRLCKKWGADC